MTLMAAFEPELEGYIAGASARICTEAVTDVSSSVKLVIWDDHEACAVELVTVPAALAACGMAITEGPLLP